MKKKHPSRIADEAAIAVAPLFTVVRFRGRSPTDGAVPRSQLYDVKEFKAEDGDSSSALEAARRYRLALGRDGYGRGAVIYAVSQSGMTIFVE